MAKTNSIPIELLRQLLEYKPETGELFWKARTPEMFASNGRRSQQNICINWNKRYSGKRAFTARIIGRYFCGRILGKLYLAHRVIWAIVYGEWPDEVDHGDQDGFNNKLYNLQSVTSAENSRNQKLNSLNTSGVCGVWKQDARWVAEIKIGQKKISLGSYSSLDEAAQARKSAEVKYGFHPNHGKSG